MADDQEPSNDVGEGGETPEISDYEEQTTSVIGIGNTTTPLPEAYDDEPIEDYVVNMVVNEQSDGASLSPDLINAAITDSNGNIISSRTKLYDSINGYTTAIYDELNGNGTANTDGKRWWGKFVKQKSVEQKLGQEEEKKGNRSICVCKCVYAFGASAQITSNR